MLSDFYDRVLLCLETEKMCAAIQFFSGCASGVAESAANLATPSTCCWGNFHMAGTFVARYQTVKPFIECIHVYILLCVSPSVSFDQDGIFSEEYQEDLGAQ